MNVENYNNCRGVFSPLIEHNGRICGMWLVGNNYRNSTGYFGAYPPSYLKRMAWLFPEENKSGRILHLFSGMIYTDEKERISTFDIKEDTPATHHGNAENVDLFFHEGEFDLILSDPPYDNNHVKYGTEKVNKKKTIKACSRILKPGGHLVWLDTIMPIWSKKDRWRLVGTIGFLQSTNHKVRIATILRKEVNVN